MLQTRCQTAHTSLKRPALHCAMLQTDAQPRCSGEKLAPVNALLLKGATQRRPDVYPAAGSTTSLPHYINAVAMLLPLYRRKKYFLTR